MLERGSRRNTVVAPSLLTIVRIEGGPRQHNRSILDAGTGPRAPPASPHRLQCIIGTQISGMLDITRTSRSSPNLRAGRFVLHRLSDDLCDRFPRLPSLRTGVTQSLV